MMMFHGGAMREKIDGYFFFIRIETFSGGGGNIEVSSWWSVLRVRFPKNIEWVTENTADMK